MEFYCILTFLGIKIIEIDVNFDPIFCKEFEQAMDDAVDQFIDRNSLFLYKYLKLYINFLPNTYEPLYLENAPNNIKSKAIIRNDTMKDDYLSKMIIKIIRGINPVFEKNVIDEKE